MTISTSQTEMYKFTCSFLIDENENLYTPCAGTSENRGLGGRDGGFDVVGPQLALSAVMLVI